MTQRSLYTFEIWDSFGSLVADISGIALSRSFRIRRNRAEEVTFTCRLESVTELCTKLNIPFSTLFDVGRGEVRIKRGQTYLLGAKIMYARPNLTTEQSTVDIRAVGFLELLNYRYLQPSFTFSYPATDLGQVAWSFINQSQSLPNGDLGITLGSITASHNTDASDIWKPYAKSISSELVDMTKRYNSFDFAFTYDKKFNVYYPGQGTDKPELRFSFPGNIKSAAIPIDATQLANFFIERGSGNPPVVETRTDSGSAGFYARYERIEDQASVAYLPTLDSYGDEGLRMYAYPTNIPSVTIDGIQAPYLGDFWIGDRIRFDVTANIGLPRLGGQTWRINDINVALGEDDQEDIVLLVGYN